jgi:hypothetical protein
MSLLKLMLTTPFTGKGNDELLEARKKLIDASKQIAHLQ